MLLIKKSSDLYPVFYVKEEIGFFSPYTIHFMTPVTPVHGCAVLEARVHRAQSQVGVMQIGAGGTPVLLITESCFVLSPDLPLISGNEKVKYINKK